MVSHVFRGQHCRTSHPMVSHATKQPEPWRPMHLGCGVGKQQWCLQHMANRLLGRTPASEEACNKVSSQRQLARGPFNTIWTPTHALTPPPPPCTCTQQSSCHLDIVAYRFLSIFCMDLQRGRLQFIYFFRFMALLSNLPCLDSPPP